LLQRVLVLCTEPVPCLSPGPPSTYTVLRWDRYGTIAVYTCPVGYIFIEGGTTRTLGCNTGQWPDLLPVCHGIICTLQPISGVRILCSNCCFVSRNTLNRNYKRPVDDRTSSLSPILLAWPCCPSL